MRDPFTIIVTLTFLTLGVLVWVVKQPHWVNGMSPLLSRVIHGRELAEQKPAPDDPKPAPRRAKRETGTAERSANPEVASRIEGSKPLDGLEIQETFPIDQQIAKGTSQSMVLGRYGKPSFWVTIPDSGELFQQFIYIDRSTGRKTHVFFTNSFVTSAQTTF